MYRGDGRDDLFACTSPRQAVHNAYMYMSYLHYVTHYEVNGLSNKTVLCVLLATCLLLVLLKNIVMIHHVNFKEAFGMNAITKSISTLYV